MKLIVMIFMVISLQGCAGLGSYIPSFWDDNQSARIVDIELTVDQLDCTAPQAPQVQELKRQLRWFELYSLSKGTRQTDVLKLTEPIKLTVEDWHRRLATSKDNPVYCQLKRQILIKQTHRAAQAVLGRF